MITSMSQISHETDKQCALLSWGERQRCHTHHVDFANDVSNVFKFNRK